MVGLEDNFVSACKMIKEYGDFNRVDEHTQLVLYGYYKQALNGDCDVSEPSIFYVKSHYKWEKWNSLRGMSQQKAMIEYINIVKSVVGI